MLVHSFRTVDGRFRQSVGRLAAISFAAVLVIGLAAGNVLAAADQPKAPKLTVKGVPGAGAVRVGREVGAGLAQPLTPPLVRYMASQAARLKLTDEQYSAVRSTYQDLQGRLQRLLAQIRQERETLVKLWRQPEIDEQAVLASTERLTKLWLEVRSKVAAAQDKIEAVLTPAQLKELENLKNQWQRQRQAQLQVREQALDRVREQTQDRVREQVLDRVREQAQERIRERARQMAEDRVGMVWRDRWPAHEPMEFMLMFPWFRLLPFGR